MKYQIMMFATALAFSGLAGAADKTSANKDQMSEYQVECLESALAEEDQPEGAEKDAYVKECIEKKQASEPKAKDKNS